MLATGAAGRGCRLGLGLLAALAWCSFPGCGAPAYKPTAPPLEGYLQWEKGPTVTELEGGSVEFEKGGTVTTAALAGDGSFRLDRGLPPGKYRVRVVPPATPTRKGAEMDPRYRRFETSGLEYTATSGPGQVTLQLKKRGR